MRVTLVSLAQTIVPITCFVVSPYILQHIGIGEWSWVTVALCMALSAIVSLPRWLSILLEVLPYCQIMITIIALYEEDTWGDTLSKDHDSDVNSQH